MNRRGPDAAAPDSRDSSRVCFATATTESFVPGALTAVGSFLQQHPCFEGDVVVIHDGLPRESQAYLEALSDRVHAPVCDALQERRFRGTRPQARSGRGGPGVCAPPPRPLGALGVLEGHVPGRYRHAQLPVDRRRSPTIGVWIRRRLQGRAGATPPPLSRQRLGRMYCPRHRIRRSTEDMSISKTSARYSPELRVRAERSTDSPAGD